MIFFVFRSENKNEKICKKKFCIKVEKCPENWKGLRNWIQFENLRKTAVFDLEKADWPLNVSCYDMFNLLSKLRGKISLRTKKKFKTSFFLYVENVSLKAFSKAFSLINLKIWSTKIRNSTNFNLNLGHKAKNPSEVENMHFDCQQHEWKRHFWMNIFLNTLRIFFSL